MKIEWNEDINDEALVQDKEYLVTIRNLFTNQTYMNVSRYYGYAGWAVTIDEQVLAWADIEPFVEDNFEVGDIVKDTIGNRVGMIMHINDAYRPYHIIWDTGCCWDYSQSDMEIFKKIDNNKGLVNKVVRELNFIKDECAEKSKL